MKYNTLPRTDLSVSQLCFGCWGLTEDFHWGQRQEQDSVRAIVSAVDQGINLFDTAPVYGDGASETLLGQVLSDHGLRNSVVVATKILPSKMHPNEVPGACEESLKRLNTDHIDLYQTHWTDRSIPLAETWGAMQRLKEQGKVRHIGVCNAGVGDLDEIIPIEKPVTDQLPYNLLWRMIEDEIQPKCIAEEIGILAYSPLMHGILAGKYKTADDVPDGRARSRHFSSQRAMTRHGEPGCEAETFAAVDAIRSIANRLGRSMAEIALAWTFQQPGVTSVIAGARDEKQVQQNIACLGQTLDAETIDELNRVTESLKKALGPNCDMWDGSENSRYR